MQDQSANQGDGSSFMRVVLVALLFVASAAWVVVLGVCGVAGDGVHIPLLARIALTIPSLALPVLLIRFGGKIGIGCGGLLGLYMLLMLLIMWTWNAF